MNDNLWIEAKVVALYEKWTWSTRFHILCTRLPEMYKWVNRRPTEIQKTTRPESIWPEAWNKILQETFFINYRMRTKCQTASSTSRLSETGKDTALAMPCSEKVDSRGQPQTVATSIDAREEQ